MNTFLAYAVAMVAGALLYMVIFLPIAQKKRWATSLIIVRGVAAMFLLGGIAAQLAYYSSFEPVYMPLDSWLRIGELGYKAIWLELAQNLGAFLPFGILLPFAIKQVNSIKLAFLTGAVVSLVLGGAMLLTGCFVTDAVLSAMLGTVAGFSTTALFGWIVPRFKPMTKLNFSKVTHSIGVFYLLFIYFAGVGALIMDNGSAFVPLNIFSPEQPLPALTYTVELPENTSKVMTYETVKTNLKADAKNVATACSIAGEPEVTGQRATVTQDSKSVTLATTGEWRYSDSAVGDGEVSDDEAREAAIKFLSNGLMGNFAITDSTIEPVESEGVVTGKQVYLEIGIGGKRIKGSCEVVVIVGAEGKIKSADKHSAYFQEYKKVTAISAKTAMDRAISGIGGHTLFDEATSAVVTDVQSAYWLEEVKGILQPIWLFSATATLPGGSTEPFEIYVPAIK